MSFDPDRVKDIEKRLRKWSRDLTSKLQGGSHAREIMREHSDVVRKRFKSKTDPDGKTWKKWSSSYAATRKRRHSLLMNTRDLFKSLGRSSIKRDGKELKFGSRLKYAAAVNSKRQFMGFGRDTDPLQDKLESIVAREMAKHGIK